MNTNKQKGKRYLSGEKLEKKPVNELSPKQKVKRFLSGERLEKSIAKDAPKQKGKRYLSN